MAKNSSNNNPLTTPIYAILDIRAASNMKTIVLISLLSFNMASAFIPSRVPVAWGQGTSLSFGLPSFGGRSDEKEENPDKKEKKISAGGLLQLITAGMGAPFLGDFEGVDEVRPCRVDEV
jgi:hypothetical protein